MVEIDILKVDENLTHEYKDCLLESKCFNGYGCENAFCDWLFTEENSNTTVIAHNGAGYDNKFILQYCLNRCLIPSSFIRQGSRITYMNFNRFSIRFIDSYNFIQAPLKSLSKTYDIDTLKGYFPHHFNRPENQKYQGVIPSEKDFGANNMMPDDYEKIIYEEDGKTIKLREGFKPWYEQQQHITDWNFKNELIKYCRADVELLSKTVLKFRKMFIDKQDTDPFRYTTLPSVCMSVFINNFLPEKTIVANNTEKKDSLVCREWLNYLNNPNIYREVPLKVNNDDQKCDIHRNKVGKFCEYYNLKNAFTVDGYDQKNNTVYQFYGCYWHGCRKCHPENVIKYNKTMEQENLIEHNGYKLVHIWECEWNKIKNGLPDKTDFETEAKQHNINIRDALFGGRTEGFKSYHKCSLEEMMFYFDIVSLYPTVNALDEYAVGFNRYVYNLKVDDIMTGKFFGLVKCDIEPPKDLYIPVLPDNIKGKLLFHLNNMYEKSITSIELQFALKLGYKITKIHSALEFKKMRGLMKDYVEFFLKIKIENNKHYTPEECDRINNSHKKLGFSFEIKSENTCKNPGMKQLAKLCLNSLWGKFGQRANLDSYEYITDWNRLLLQLNDTNVTTNSWHIINSNCVELRYNDNIDYNIEADYISEVTAVFTTANARIRLMSMLLWLDPSQIVYCDTDSVIFIYNKNNPKHKYPSNDATDLPDNIRFGDGLGEWENELPDGEWIDEIIVGGAKSYSYKTNKGKIVIKQKGITLDRNNSNIFTFENVKDMVLKDVKLVSEKRYQFTWNSHTKDIETKYLSRTVQSTVDTKRILLDNYDTLPFGYQK
jgi:hypothetical protein